MKIDLDVDSPNNYTITDFTELSIFLDENLYPPCEISPFRIVMSISSVYPSRVQ